MDLITYVKMLSKKEAVAFRKRLVFTLEISASYARHLCNGRNKVPSKHALVIERLTEGMVSRFITAPNYYPEQENKECYAQVHQDIPKNMDK